MFQKKSVHVKTDHTKPSRNVSWFGRKNPPAQQPSKARNLKNQNLQRNRKKTVTDLRHNILNKGEIFIRKLFENNIKCDITN